MCPDFTGEESHAIGCSAPALPLCPSLAAKLRPKEVIHQVAVDLLLQAKLGFLLRRILPLDIMVCAKVFLPHLKHQLQAHICPLKEEHPIGFDCLSDEQTLHILMFMDPDSLMNFSRFPIIVYVSNPYQSKALFLFMS